MVGSGRKSADGSSGDSGHDTNGSAPPPRVSSADCMKPSASTAQLMQLTGGAQQANFDEEFSRVHVIADILFCASVGNLRKLKQIVSLGSVDLSSDKACDYDKRTALHLSADSGSVRVTRWLVDNHARVNAVDRMGATPLACAARNRHTAIVQVLVKAGGKVLNAQGDLVKIEDSELYSVLTGFSSVSSLYENPQLKETWEIQAGEIEELDVIGAGQFGTVKKAMWRGTQVAVKRLKEFVMNDPISMEEFKTELNTMAMLHHPHTVQFLGVVLGSTTCSIVTEFMEHGSLENAFFNPIAFSQMQAVNACIDIARGMTYLHAHRPSAVIHRDLKPANLMVSRSGKIKIGDFGLSRTLRHTDTRAESMKRMLKDKYKMTGETGSYRYMAPEVFRHEAYGPSVDVYAFAMIAYQCFTWRRPFEAYSGVEAAQAAAINGVRPSIAGIRNKQVAKMLAAAWDPDPALRPTFTELLTMLDEIQASTPGKATAAVTREREGGAPGCECVIS